MENDNEKKGYIKGLFTGAILVVCGILTFNSLGIIIGAFGREFTHTQKAKYINNLLDKFYVDDITEDELYEGIYAGMVSGPTDRYSYYMDSESYKSFRDSTEGNYLGIGVMVSIDPKDKKIVVNAVFEQSPSEVAGILINDKIVKINGIDVGYDNYSDALSMIKGEEDTDVQLTLYRESQDKYIETKVTRSSVDLPTVAHEMLADDIGYIIISQFDGVTYNQFNEAYTDLQQQGMKALILDLRNNPGGLLTSVRDIADIFLPEGILTYTEDKNGKKEYEYTTGEGSDIPLAVLINENSASASELLAGAIKDLKAGTLIGTTSFRKGVVQTIYPLKDGSAVKITTAKYYTPNGVCIHGVGVEPDVELEPNEDLIVPSVMGKTVNIDVTKDNQVDQAMEILKSK